MVFSTPEHLAVAISQVQVCPAQTIASQTLAKHFLTLVPSLLVEAITQIVDGPQFG